tara:strand:- start:110 stop:346 length:237 start_codon:yes stop_codon:yes gene_type:complete
MKTTDDIVDRIVDKLPYSKKTIKLAISKTFESLEERFAKEEKVMLRGFMKFVCSSRETWKKPDKLNMKDYLKLKTKDK